MFLTLQRELIYCLSLLARSLFVDLFEGDLTASEVSIEAKSDVVRPWLFLVCRTETKKPIFGSIWNDFAVRDLSDKYQTYVINNAWMQQIELAWDLPLYQSTRGLTFKAYHNFEAFLWACRNKNLHLAKKAIRVFKDQDYVDGTGSLVDLAPWKMPGRLADKIEQAGFRALVRACFANQAHLEEIDCGSCAGTGSLYARKASRKCWICDGSGKRIERRDCDWIKVAESFAFDDALG